MADPAVNLESVDAPKMSQAEASWPMGASVSGPGPAGSGPPPSYFQERRVVQICVWLQLCGETS